MKIKFSIIIPSLNNKRFLNRCLKSIFMQTYKNYEIIIIDGGSTDGTRSIIKKYKNKIKFYVNKDKGQYDAINKGILVSTGNWIAWQNCDDYYFDKNAFKIFASKIIQNPDKKLFIANINLINSRGKILRDIKFLKPSFHSLLYEEMTLTNQACFWNKKLHLKLGYLRKMRINFDYEWFLRILNKYKNTGCNINKVLACYRLHKMQKTQNQTFKDISNKEKIKIKYGYNKKYYLIFKFYLNFRKIFLYLMQGDYFYILRGIYKFFFKKKNEEYIN